MYFINTFIFEMPKCNEKKIYDSFIKTKRSFSTFHTHTQKTKIQSFSMSSVPPGVLKILTILLSNSLTKSQKNVDIPFSHQKKIL